jgi:hypothetical protein
MGSDGAPQYEFVQCGNLFVALHKKGAHYVTTGHRDLPLQAQQQDARNVLR